MTPPGSARQFYDVRNKSAWPATNAHGRAHRSIPPHGRLFQQHWPVQVRLRARHRRRITILLDPGRFLNRLLTGLILMLPAIVIASIDRGRKCRGDGIERG